MSNLIENTSAENLKTTPDKPTEKPINNNIRERLNLHVKRRIQESAADTSSHNNNDTTANNNNEEVKTRKQYTKRIDKPTAPLGRRPKRAKLKHIPSASTVSIKDTESVGSVASTSTTASAGDDEGSRDDNSQGADVPHSPREKEKCPDLLSLVLNVKKRALFRDPEVVKFLQGMMDILRE